MNKIFTLILILAFQINYAQKNCEYSVNISDSLGTLKSTKDCLMYQKMFGGLEKSIFFTLTRNNNLPILQIQTLQKSTQFIPAFCVDQDSKVYLQLANGKIVTLLSLNEDSCGTSLLIDGKNSRILTSYFLILNENFEDLKLSPITLVRMKFSTETFDFVVTSELVSELDKITYFPDSFIIKNIDCIIN